MRDRVAPEIRGTQARYCGETCRIGPVVLAALMLAATVGITGAGHGLAQTTPPAATAVQRQLQIAPDSPKPNFALLELGGSERKLQEQAGRPVLVHFFATWCEPCREELASLSRLVERTPSEKLSVLAVNVAEVPVRVQRFLETSPVNFPVLLDGDRAVTKAWGVTALPTTFVLDARLQPRLLVEGDLDWTRADVLAALDAISARRQE